MSSNEEVGACGDAQESMPAASRDTFWALWANPMDAHDAASTGARPGLPSDGRPAEEGTDYEDRFEAAAALRAKRGFPELSPDDAKRNPNIRVRSNVVTALDAVLDGLLDEGVYASRSEFFEFAVWHVIGMEPDLSYAVRRWRMAGGGTRLGRKRRT